MLNEVTIRTAKHLICMSYANEQAVLLLGTPGIGKTECVEQAAKDLGIGFLCHEGPGLDPTDGKGYILPDKEKKVAYFTKSALLPDVKIHGPAGILLIDELTAAPPAVQVSLHSLFHSRERRLGEHRLPDGWIPVATGNYSADEAGARNTLTTIMDRVRMIAVCADLKVWKEDYAIPNKIHPIVLGFLNFRPALFDTFSKRTVGEKHKSFGTPRSHTQVSKDLYYADKHSLPEEMLLAAISGWVGSGIAVEYMGFIKTYGSLPNIDDIIKGYNFVSDDPGIIYAVYAALVDRVGRLKRAQVPKVIERLLDYSTKNHLDFGGVLIRDLWPFYKKEIKSASNWFSIAPKYDLAENYE